PPALANHTFTFTIQDDWAAGETLSLNINDADDATNFDTSGFATTDALDYDITDDGVEQNLVDTTGGCTAATLEIQISALDTTNDMFTFTRCASDATIASGSVVVIE